MIPPYDDAPAVSGSCASGSCGGGVRRQVPGRAFADAHAEPNVLAAACDGITLGPGNRGRQFPTCERAGRDRCRSQRRSVRHSRRRRYRRRLAALQQGSMAIRAAATGFVSSARVLTLAADTDQVMTSGVVSGSEGNFGSRSRVRRKPRESFPEETTPEVIYSGRPGSVKSSPGLMNLSRSKLYCLS
jgi:hypothetical protein